MMKVIGGKKMEKLILQTNQVSKSFQNQKVLKEVSLAVPENCVYGLLGPNGAGKSTLLKIITGITRPTKGSVTFSGHPWTRKDLKSIGALIETPPIYENLTAWENLKVRAILLNIPDSRIREVLELTDLSGTGKKRAGHFSLGMKQRLGIAIALLNHPKFLILDEPVNGLDPVGIREFRVLVRRCVQNGITVLISSHILSEIEQTADYIGILTEGRIGFQGWLSDCGDLEKLFMEVVVRDRKEGIR